MRLSSTFVRCAAVALLTLFLALAPAIPAQAMTSGAGGSFWGAAIEWIHSVFSSNDTTDGPDLRKLNTEIG